MPAVAVYKVNGEERPAPLQEHETYWQNRFYLVNKTLLEGTEEGAIHLSIRHADRTKSVRDWRHFQRIKNELAGPEREAIEIFPAESDLVDMANQFHLWVLPAGDTTPFTWHSGRLVDAEGERAKILAKQMGYDPEMLKNARQRPL